MEDKMATLRPELILIGEIRKSSCDMFQLQRCTNQLKNFQRDMMTIKFLLVMETKDSPPCFMAWGCKKM